MSQSRRQVTFTTVLLLFVGFVAAVLAFWFFDQQPMLSGAGIITLLLLGVFFVSYTAALWRYLRWRDKELMVSTVTAPSRADLKGTVYGLIPGCEYRVMRSFADYYRNSFEQGDRLRFKQRHFLPYHGGHTIVFVERPLYLQEEQNTDILENFSAYIAQSKQ